ncbi:hypothetical protein B0T26DRAFT_744233 [Lasiosphaeria miniovina]|uniref:Ataxin-10 domain-containing protein n=1 Tax=Lasiosphaeria miniovina TaxID=1954250 RepID=A0AA39ZTK5_9PEZI|nr:uncharacterized protein B0T26DRAFT_744233 [Lasiosphaeria miniovina]KAK0703305.1 hypothetical protein B0T26DRAFT_744233 [Lasiosphaeria miniovina]
MAAEVTQGRRPISIEELCFTTAMSCYEGRLKRDPAIGPQTMAMVAKFISRTLETTHNLRDVRETLSSSVEIWIWLTKDFAAAIPSLTTRSIGPLATLNDATSQESTALITKNYTKLLVVTEAEVAQDLCAAAQFDRVLYQTIIVCVNVTSKAYDGDILEDGVRLRVGVITELYKKFLVLCLQQAYTWIAKNDRTMTSFWSTVLFDDETAGEEEEANAGAGDFCPVVAKMEVQNWIERNSRVCDKARQLLIQYEETIASRGHPPGNLSAVSPLFWNWLPEGTIRTRAGDAEDDAEMIPHWKEDEPDKFEQDRAYGRVSKEVDTWWLKVRDPNHDGWAVPMPLVEFAKHRTENRKADLVNRYRTDEREGSVHSTEAPVPPDVAAEEEHEDGRAYSQDYDDDTIEEEDVDHDDSYAAAGLLTEVPSILDPEQIEALHMMVKSCILDNAGLALTRAGEKLQETRCRMFLAFKCGRNLLREMLVFIAVWEENKQSRIFQLTTQIVEAIHHSALIPYAWQCLQIPKDIISPAQTLLLRLVNNTFRARNANPPSPDSEEHLRDVKLLHFLFVQFRSRIVPEYAALMRLQEQILRAKRDPADFPVSADMKYAKDGLEQFLELLTIANEVVETREYLIEWEAAYELLVLLRGLEAGVAKKPPVDLTNHSTNEQTPDPSPSETPIDDQRRDDGDSQHPRSDVKGKILHTLAGLLQPPPGQSSPGDPTVQAQILRHQGLVTLLNCCVYDDPDRYAREGVQICLKWLLDGSDAANHFLREPVAMMPPHNPGGP